MSTVILSKNLNTYISSDSSNAFSNPIQVVETIGQATLERAKAFVLAHWETITDYQARIKEMLNKDSLFHFYGAKHCVVFSHPDFQELILKVMDSGQAEESKRSENKARQVFAHQRFQYCHVPQSEMIALQEKKVLLVMEKAKGNTDVLSAKEEMETEFEQIDSDPNIAAKWKQMTREVAQATAAIGYWDSQRKNLIWDSQKGWSFIDFERIEPTQNNIKTGLDRLAEIFPPHFVEEIYIVADDNGVKLDKTKEAAKADRLAQFKLSRDSFRWNQEKGCPRILDKEKWDPSSWERKTLEEFDTYRNQEWNKNCPAAQTELLWLPFQMIFNTLFPSICGEEYKKASHSVYLENLASFESALENLKKEGVIRTWTTFEGGVPHLIQYNIFF